MGVKICANFKAMTHGKVIRCVLLLSLSLSVRKRKKDRQEAGRLAD